MNNVVSFSSLGRFRPAGRNDGTGFPATKSGMVERAGGVCRRAGPARRRPGGARWLLLLSLLGAVASAQGPGAGDAQAGADALSPGLPPGAIIAFMPRFGREYRDAAELDAWLADRGFALCDGRHGTPDLRDRMLLGTATAGRAGEALGSRDHEHPVSGETDAPVRRNRPTPTGREQLVQLPDDQHRHRLDLRTGRADHLPPSVRVLFIMKLD